MITEEDKEDVKRRVRALAPEFKDGDKPASDDELNILIDVLAPLVAKKKFADSYALALAFLVCHKLKMNGYGDTSLGTLSDASRIGSYSEGGVSISYSNWMGGNASATDAEYGLTIYGVQYLNLRKRYVPTITIAGTNL